MTAVPSCVMLHVFPGWDRGRPDIFIISVSEGPVLVALAFRFSWTPVRLRP